MVFEHLSLVIATFAILSACAFTTYSKLTALPEVPAGLPWVGRLEGWWFREWKAKYKAFSEYTVLLEDGYRKYSKAGLSFVLPNLNGSIVMLPGTQVKWIIEQPDHVLNVKDMQRDSLQTDWTLLDPAMARDPIHEFTLKRELTRALPGLIPEIMEELQVAIDKFWGLDTEEWREVVPFMDMMRVVARASNRVFVGLPLCRNEDYLKNAAGFAQDVGISSFFLRLIPTTLKPILSWIPLLPNRWHFLKCSQYLFPFIIKRMADIDAGVEVPSDFTTWFIQGLTEMPGREHERNKKKIALRLMTLNFASIHTSTFTATNLLFDLYSSSSSSDCVAAIREEVETLLSASSGKWNKEVVSKMIKTDSAIRESLRLSTFLAHGMGRVVVGKDGVTMSDGLHLPQGTRLGTPARAIHMDEGIYQSATTYDALRFSRAREEAISTSPSSPPFPTETAPNGNATSQDKAQEPGSRTQKILDAKNLSTVTTSPTFLAFGHGRHACPGRFFAATEMKLLLAYIVLNYEVQHLDERPRNLCAAGSVLPPMRAKMTVRRRKGTVL